MNHLIYAERILLRTILLDAFNTVISFTQLSQALEVIADKYSPTAGIEIRLDTLIADFDDRGEIHKLLEKAPTTAGWEQNENLKVKLLEFRKAWEKRREISPAILNNPYQAWRVDQGRLFIDRKILRKHAEDLAENNRRFMVVNGPTGSGKTYSIYYLNFLRSMDRFKFKASLIELEREVRTTYYPDVLARRIVRDLSLPSDDIPQQQNVKDRWAGEVCDWLVDQLLRAEPNLYWIVLDGFSDPNLPKETKEMVVALIDAVDKRLTNVRLVLIDYSEALPRSIRALVKDEALHHFDREELKLFFQERFEQAEFEYDDELITEAVDRVMTGLPDDNKERMENITERVSESLEQLGIEEEPL